jgi:hypothetical protein
MNTDTTPAEAPPEEDIAPKPAPRARDAVGWQLFHGKMVMLQFREPYIGVDFRGDTYQPSMSRDGAGVAAIPIFAGVLSVEYTLEGIVLIVRRRISERESCVIAVSPADVLYCTHIQRSLITG